MAWGTDVEIEIRNRIWVACAAYAYEMESNPIMSDGNYDKLCLMIRPEMETGNQAADEFFRNEFESHTGAWIYGHPDLQGLKRICEIIRKGKQQCTKPEE